MQHNRAAASATRTSSMFDTIPKSTVVPHVSANLHRTHVTPRSGSQTATSVSTLQDSPLFAKTNLSPSGRGARKVLYRETKTPSKHPPGWRCKTPDHRGNLKLTLKNVTAKPVSETPTKRSDVTRFDQNTSPKTPRRVQTQHKQSVSTATLQLSMPCREQIQHARSTSIGNMILKTPRKVTPPKTSKTPKKRVTLTSVSEQCQSPGARDSSLFMTPQKFAHTPGKTGTPPTNFTPRRSRRISEVMFSPEKCTVVFGASTVSNTCGLYSPLKTPKSIVSRETLGGAPCLSQPALLDQSASCDAWALNTPTKDDHSVTVTTSHTRRMPRHRTMSCIGAKSVGNLPTTPHKRRHSQTVQSTPKGMHCMNKTTK